MKKRALLIFVAFVCIPAAAFVVANLGISPGEYKIDGGSVYVFNDGLIACETRQHSKRFYIAKIDPARVADFEFAADGFRIELRESLPDVGLPERFVSFDDEYDRGILVLQKHNGQYTVEGAILDRVAVARMVSSRDWDSISRRASGTQDQHESEV